MAPTKPKIIAGNGPFVKVKRAGTFTHTVNHITNLPKNTQRPDSIPFRLPDPETNFTGRETELKRLHNAVQRINNSPNNIEGLITVVSGLGGIGKTQLVRKYVQLNESKFYGNIIWIDAGNNGELVVETFIQLAKNELGITTLDANGGEKNINTIIKCVYDYFREENVLFVYDNVERIDDIKKFLVNGTRSSQSKTRSYFILTSRLQEWDVGIEVIRLEEWRPDEAATFVSTILGCNQADQYDINLLVAELQGFPLTLRQATSYIVDQRVTGEFSIRNYLTKYDKMKKDLVDSKIFQNGISSQYTETTFTTWNVTISTIEQDDDFGSLAMKILYTIAYFAPNNIYRASLFDIPYYKENSGGTSYGKYAFQLVVSELFHLPKLYHKEFNHKPKKSVVDNEESVKSAVRLLVKYSMISSQDKQSILSIHRVVQDVIRITLKFRQKEIIVLNDALILMTRLMKRTAHTEHAVSVFQHCFQYTDLIRKYCALANTILMNLIIDLRFLQAFLFGSQFLEKFENNFPINQLTIRNIKGNVKFVQVYTQGLVWTGFESGMINESLYRTYEQLHKERLNEFGENDTDTVAVKLIIVAILMYWRRYPDAFLVFEELSSKYREMENFKLELDALNEVGFLCVRCGLNEKALAIYRNLYERTKVKFGEHHPVAFYVLNKIGVTRFKQMHYKDGLENFQTILNQGIFLGDDNEIILVAIQNIALTYYEMGHHDESIKLNKQIHSKRLQFLGKNHPKTLISLNMVGMSLIKQMKYEDALQICLEVCKNGMHLRHDNPIILDAMENMGWINYKLLNYDKSLALYNDIHAKRLAILGKTHPDTLRILNKIGLTLLNQKYYEKCLRTFEEVIKYKTEVGEDNEVILEVMHNIGLTYYFLGDTKKSLEMYKEAHAKREKLFGEKHVDTLRSLYGIGLTFLKENNYEDALKAFQRVVINRIDLTGDSELILNVIVSLGWTYYTLGSNMESLVTYTNIHTYCIKILGAKHPETLGALNGIGNIHMRLMNYNEALQAFEEIYNKRSELGEDNEMILEAMDNMGWIYSDLGKYEKSLEMHKQVHKKRVELLGKNHPETLASLNGVGLTLIKQMKYKDGLKIFQEIFENRADLEDDSDLILNAMENIGWTLYKLGRNEESLENYYKVHKKRIEILGENDENTLRAWNVMGLIFLDQKRNDEALQVFQNILKNQDDLGEDNQVILDAMENIGWTYSELGRYAESLEMHKQTHAKRKQLLGAKHPETLGALNGIGTALMKQMNYEECLQIFEEILKNKEELSEYSEVIIDTMESMGLTYFKVGNYQKSLDLRKGVHAKRSFLLGEDHPETVTAWNDLMESETKC